MSPATGITWEGAETVEQNMRGYPRVVRRAIASVSRKHARKMGRYAKANAKWTDRTGEARKRLFAKVEINGESVIINLSHGVFYGLFLEIKNQGRFAIIWPTIRATQNDFVDDLQAIFAAQSVAASRPTIGGAGLGLGF